MTAGRRGHFGFSLIELITGLGVSAVVLLISAGVLTHLYKEKKRADTLLAISEIRAFFQHAVLNQASWAQSLASDSMASCFSGTTASSCIALSGMTPRDLKLYSGSQLLFDSTDANAGFTDKGQACSTFASSNDCVLKPHVTWQAQCNLAADAACTSPLILVRLSYQTSSSFDLGSMNLESYGFQVSKATFGIQAANSCSGAVPACTATQAAICEAGTWTCEEFGL